MNNESDNGDWFRDRKLEMIYKHDLYSEILQIIHRTALRIINSKQPIHIYMAYDEEDKISNYDSYSIEPISENLNERYLKNEAVLTPHYKLLDISLYNRDKKIEGFANQARLKLTSENKTIINANGVSLSFKKYLHNHWEDQQETIKGEFNSLGLDIFIDKNDKRQTKKIKYLNN